MFNWFDTVVWGNFFGLFNIFSDDNIVWGT